MQCSVALRVGGNFPHGLIRQCGTAFDRVCDLDSTRLKGKGHASKGAEHRLQS
jgi:hypothetical protein